LRRDDRHVAAEVIVTVKDSGPLAVEGLSRWLHYGELPESLDATSAELLPDFLVISPPRTGTTWLANCLRAHPSVFIPEEKELHYFDWRWKTEPLTAYVRPFEMGAGRLKGEATPLYALLPDQVISAIRRLKPDLKLILLPRRPAHRAWSSLKHCIQYRQDVFRNGPDDPSAVREDQALLFVLSDYCRACNDYAAILARWTRHFPACSVFVEYFERAIHDPRAFFDGVVRFLGLDRPVELSDDALGKVYNASVMTPPPRWFVAAAEASTSDGESQLQLQLSGQWGVAPAWPDPEASRRAARGWTGFAPTGDPIEFDGSMFRLVGSESPPAGYVGDLLIRLARRETPAAASPMSVADERLCRTIDRMADDYGRYCALVLPSRRLFSLEQASSDVRGQIRSLEARLAERERRLRSLEATAQETERRLRSMEAIRDERGGQSSLDESKKTAQPTSTPGDGPGERPGGSAPLPFLMWATFNDCNFSCKYCPTPDDLLRPKSASFRRFYDIAYHDRMLDFFHRLYEHSGAWVVCLTGGEPLLMPNLEYLTSGLIRTGHRIRYNTNLSIDLDSRPGWFAANPPSGVDVLMVSIHDESMPQLDALHARVRDLKSRGYRIIVRVVCTPDKLPLLDELEERFRESDVTFTPLPEIEYRSARSGIGALPRAYTPAQRDFLAARFKGYGELAMLYGGIDVSGRSCFAGSRMLFMSSHSTASLAQISPCNLTTDVVLADVAEFIGPRPRGIESLLARGAAPCRRKNRRCDCPGLVENDVIEGVVAHARYREMASGYVPALGSAAAAWVQRCDIRFGEDSPDLIEAAAADLRTAEPPRLVEAVGVFNIVWYAGAYLGVPQALGPIDLREQDISSLPGIVRAETLREARRMVRASHAQ
jgi:MoaA/NifB/PqqE/SkfB family radical SAM enzyme